MRRKKKQKCKWLFFFLSHFVCIFDFSREHSKVLRGAWSCLHQPCLLFLLLQRPGGGWCGHVLRTDFVLGTVVLAVEASGESRPGALQAPLPSHGLSRQDKFPTNHPNFPSEVQLRSPGHFSRLHHSLFFFLTFPSLLWGCFEALSASSV